MPRFFSIFSPLLRLFPITLSPPPLFPFAHASFFFFSSSLLSPLNFGTLEPRIGSLVGRFQGFPRLSYKAKTWLERVDIHSTRARPTFTTQTWISMVSPNKYDEVSRMLLTASNCFSLEHGGKLLPGFEIMASLYEIGRNAYVLSRLGGWRR